MLQNNRIEKKSFDFILKEFVHTQAISEVTHIFF